MHITVVYGLKEFPLTVQDTDTVLSLKTLLEQLIDFSTDRIELKCNGVVLLTNSFSLFKYGVEEGSTLTITILPPQLHTLLFVPSRSVYSITAVILLFLSTQPSLPSFQDTTSATAFVSCCAMIIYHLVKIILPIVVDNFAVPTVGITRAIATTFMQIVVVSILIHDVCYRTDETSPLLTVLGGINCLNCIAALYIHHVYLAKAFNEHGQYSRPPNGYLYDYISCPNFLLEAIFSTTFMLCTCFTTTSIIFCIFSWIFAASFADSRHKQYKQHFLKYDVPHRLIPFIW
ncbi:Ubiquitin-like domain-containing protein [Entamoeba marina]